MCVLYVLVMILCSCDGVKAGSVLVWPTEGSHWINLKPLLEALVDRDHDVVALLPNTSLYMKAGEASGVDFLSFNVSLSEELIQDFLQDFQQFVMFQAPGMNALRRFLAFEELVSRKQEMFLKICDGVFASPALMEKLRNKKWDVMLVDTFYPCGDLLAELLDVPFLITHRSSQAGALERMCGHTPAKLTPNTSFSQRVFRLLFDLVQDLLTVRRWRTYDSYYTQYLDRHTSYCELTGKAELWLIRNFWDFSSPRPLLPNFIYLGGLHCRPARPLPQDVEEFVESSGDDGVVIFTLGSFIRNMSKEKRNIMAAALGQIRQKVLWTHRGDTPDTLAPNTRIYDWLPQNDLLGHPKARVFLTHGGSSGLYEAVYHGVPVVGLPLFAEQADNLHQMRSRGAAVVLDLHTLQEQELLDALNTVINDPTYKDNVMRLSRIHHERPVKAVDEAVFWLEFVMRNKGAKHLRAASHHLSWYQYHNLDILLLFITTISLLSFIIITTCRLCIQRLILIITST